MQPLVSIIVPVYNASKYLDTCVRSILEQSYKNIEVILIDDGSNDESYNLCKQYSRNDSRVLSIHHKNHGVSYTRNCGIQISKGKYICFVDSDDYIDKKFIELMLKAIDNNCDLAICRNFNCNTDGVLKEIKTKEKDFSNNLKEDYWKITNFVGGPVMKLYKKDIIINNNIRFAVNVNYSEDRMFNTKFYSKIKKYSFVNLPLYYVVNQNSSSLSKQKNLKTFQYAIDEAIMTANMLRREKFSEADTIIANHCINIINDFSINTNYNYITFLNKIQKIISIIRYTRKCSLKRKIIMLLLKNKIIFPVYIYYKLKNS